MSDVMGPSEVQVYGWLAEAALALSRPRRNAAEIASIVGPLVREARPFSLPPFTMSDPPYKGYLFESDDAVAGLDEYRQPFPVIALQFPVFDGTEYARRIPSVAIVQHIEEKQGLLIALAQKLPGSKLWSWAPAGLAVSVNGSLQHNGLHTNPVPFDGRELSKAQSQMLVNALNPAVMAAYELAVLIQCQNISIKQVQPPKQVNEKRKRKGKKPLPSGYVIAVKSDVTRYEQGAPAIPTDEDKQRKKPRTHFRRGHIRRTNSGNRVWISPTIVRPGGFPLRSQYQVLL